MVVTRGQKFAFLVTKMAFVFHLKGTGMLFPDQTHIFAKGGLNKIKWCCCFIDALSYVLVWL